MQRVFPQKYRRFNDDEREILMPTVTEARNPQLKYCEARDCHCICLTCKGRIGQDVYLCKSCYKCITLYVAGKGFLEMPDKTSCGDYTPCQA